jgi:hypothetical protein
MKSFLSAVVAAVVIAVGAMYALEEIPQRQTDEAYVSPTGARVSHDDRGHNLVGKDWFAAKQHQNP